MKNLFCSFENYIYCDVVSVYTDVIKFSVWTAAWARLWGGGAMASAWSFLTSLRSDVIGVCTASCLWTRSHYAVTEKTHRHINISWQGNYKMCLVGILVVVLWQWCLQVPGTAARPSLYTPAPWWPAPVGSYTAEEGSPAAPAPSPPAELHV